MRIFFSSGEASGDAVSASLIFHLKKNALSQGIELSFEGIGGQKFAAAGAEMIANSLSWGVIGIVQAAKVIPKVLLGYYKAKKALGSGKPGLFIPIDFGFLNIRLAKWAKDHGWKVLYFTPPGNWRKDRQGVDLPLVADAIVTPFSWSADILNQMGAKAYWFGHYLKQMLMEASPENQIKRSPNRIAFLPGSRLHEIHHNLDPVGELFGSGFLKEIEFGVASTMTPQELKSKWDHLVTAERHLLAEKTIFTQNDTYGVLQRASAAVICSGTATLEAALCKCPTVVVYRGSKMMELEYKVLRPKIKYISLPNILLDRPVFPELIQWDATPEKIKDSLLPLLEDTSERRVQIQAFEELDELLGGDQALTKTAVLALEMLKSK